MKKRILIIVFVLIFMTGCTCQYDLNIDGSNYSEEVIITGENNEESSSFNKEWNITADKNNGEFGGDPQTNDEEAPIDKYEYTLSGNTLKFNYDFSRSDYKNSYAVSNCYDTINVTNHYSEDEDYIIITTNEKNKCFEMFPSLSKLTINITVENEVTSNNADRKSGNTYTWIVTKNNADNKPINLIYKNAANVLPSIPSQSSSSHIQENKDSFLDKYALYIFLGIMIVLVLFGYYKFKQLKERSDNMDD